MQKLIECDDIKFQSHHTGDYALFINVIVQGDFICSSKIIPEKNEFPCREGNFVREITNKTGLKKITSKIYFYFIPVYIKHYNGK